MPDIRSSVIYQIYPRSFADSNGDGIGDLPGIINKLDYLANLGVDVLWLSPIFQSPNADNGYDISDYEAIMPEFGTMADFDELLAGAHQRGLRLILDLVVNHSSDEHRWFQESRKSKDNPYRDYYIWKSPPTPRRGAFRYRTADPILYGLLKEFALKNRRQPTKAESVLWHVLKEGKIDGYKFRRQYIIGPFIADFVCLEKNLIVEVDGSIHQLPENQLSDAERTQWLNEHGFRVIRCANNEVVTQMDTVIDRVAAALKAPPRGGPTGRVGGPPSNWQSFFSGPAWAFDEATGEYYLHLFAEKQPDLNWENPALRQEIYRMMRFWLDKGVDGFRMDVIPFLSKDQNFPDYPEGRFGDLTIHANGPRIHEFLHEMHQEVLAHYDSVITVGEGFGVSAEQANLYVGERREELQMIYHFDHAVPREEHRFIDPAPEFSLPELKAIFTKWNTALETGIDAPGDASPGWQNIYFGNHDNPRVLSRFGDPVNYPYESATLLATVLLTQRGTPSLYQGDEIGMSNCPFERIEEFDDIQVKNAWKAIVVPDGQLGPVFLKTANCIARDHARTPFQWSDDPNGGFTNGPKTWLKVNPNYTSVNVAQQESEPRSVLNYYRQLLRWRKQNPAIHTGSYRDLAPEHPTIWAFERTHESGMFVTVANVSDERVELPVVVEGEVVMSNYARKTGALEPWEVRVYKL